MATLLSQHRETSARIRVENIIQTDICVEVMEILELYAELLLARAGLLDLRDKEAKGLPKDSEETIPIDPGLEEAAAAMIYAAPRLPREIRELPVVRNLLVERWGKDFAAKVNENRDGIVPEKVVKKLKVEAPGDRLVELYLTEIARTYGVDWPKHTEVEGVENLQEEVDDEEEEEQPAPGDGQDGDDDGDGGGAGDQPSTPAPKKKKVDIGRAFEREQLSRATPPRDIGPGGAKSPVSVAPPAPRTDNPSPSVKFPDAGKSDGAPKAKPATTTTTTKAPTKPATQPQQPKNVVGGKIPDVDELAKRFQQLKR